MTGSTVFDTNMQSALSWELRVILLLNVVASPALPVRGQAR